MAHPAPYTTFEVFDEREREQLLSLAPTQDENYELELTGNYRTVYQAWIENEISRASEFIDSFVRKRYAVPLQDPEGLIAELCYTIALYRLFVSGRKEDIDVQNDFKEAVKYLKDMASGKEDLPGQIETANIPVIVQPFESNERGKYDRPSMTFANPPYSR